MHLQSYVGLLFFVYCGAAGNERQLLNGFDLNMVFRKCTDSVFMANLILLLDVRMAFNLVYTKKQNYDFSVKTV